MESSTVSATDNSRAATPEASAPPAGAVRQFGRYQLLRLLGKSDRTMAWAVQDTRNQQDYLLALPRKQLDAPAMQEWMQAVRRAARLNHPHIARPVEIGEHDRWPYLVYERARVSTWSERFSGQGLPAPDLARWAAQVAQGLAYAHEAGVAHTDVQAWLLGIDDNEQALVLGLELAGREPADETHATLDGLRAVRQAAEIDVLALGLVMVQGLTGQPALEEPDVARVIGRLPPLGHEFVRLPWAVPRPIPDPLRAIVNRAVDRQPRHRYRTARTLQGALEGWLSTLDDQNGGPLALLLDRLQSVGALPAAPGGAERVAHLALMERCRTSELADVVLGDIALTFELLRMVNTAQVHGEAVGADGPVLMLRRAIALLGLDGVRRAALGLRAWPGPMDHEAAGEMDSLIRRVHRAGRIAVRLAPAGYDSEVIYLIALMQNLGRLLVQYHFPGESVQIRRLMQPSETPVGAQEEPGLSAEAASFAVLGVDIEDLGVAVVRYWGLGADVQQMIRRVPDRAMVHPPESDNDILRLAGSCANELIDAAGLPPRRAQAALRKVTQRYARALGTSGREMQDALQAELNGKPITASGLGITDHAVVEAHGLAAPQQAFGGANRGGP